MLLRRAQIRHDRLRATVVAVSALMAAGLPTPAPAGPFGHQHSVPAAQAAPLAILPARLTVGHHRSVHHHGRVPHRRTASHRRHLVLPAPSVRIRTTMLDGHLSRIVSWRIGDPRVRLHVGYARHGRTTGKFGAGHRHAAALNGDMFVWKTLRPQGTTVVNGQVIRIVPRLPAIGFLPDGRIIWGARAALRRHAPNIISGKPFLVTYGHAMTRRSPDVRPAQWSCSTPNRGEGCYRSIFAQMPGQRAALFEISYISDPDAARLLVKLGAVWAIGFDSGGSATLWDSEGRGGCPRGYRGRCFGITSGRGWERLVPDAVVVTWKR